MRDRTVIGLTVVAGLLTLLTLPALFLLSMAAFSSADPDAYLSPLTSHLTPRGDRPGYRIMPAQGDRWYVDALPWLSTTATSRREALEAARAAIAEWLDVSSDSFDVEA